MDLTVLRLWCVWMAAYVHQRETDAVAYLMAEGQMRLDLARCAYQSEPAMRTLEARRLRTTNQ